MSAAGDADRLLVAQQAAAEAGRLAARHWRGRDALAVTQKASPQDVVSDADTAVERLVRAAIGRAFPGDGILGEEYGLQPGSTDVVWVIDPIDGTAPFVQGQPNWCVSIAVVRAGETVAGVIEVPAADESFAGLAGGGATLNGRPLRLPPGPTLQGGSVGIGASHRSDPAATAAAVEALMRDGGMFFRNGSGALMLAYVAAGRLVGYFEATMHPWDCLAGLLLVREAGGCTAPFGDGRDITREDRVLAGAPGAWPDLQRLFGGGR